MPMLPTPRVQHITHYLWHYASVTSLVTAKYLLLDQNFTYPTLLTFAAVYGHIAIVLVQSVSKGEKSAKSTADVTEAKCLDWTLVRKALAWQCLHITVTTLSLLLGYQALLHLPSFSTALMLLMIPLPIDYEDALRSRVRWLVLILSGAAVIFTDYRLIPNGVLLAIGSRICGALARWIQLLKAQPRVSRNTALVLMRLRHTTPVLQAVLVGFVWFKWEMVDMAHTFPAFALPSSQQMTLLTVHMMSGGYALWFSGSTFHRVEEPPWMEPYYLYMRHQGLYDGRANAAFNTACVALTMYIMIGRPADLSLWQWIAFLIACSTFRPSRDLDHDTLGHVQGNVDKAGSYPPAETPSKEAYTDVIVTVRNVPPDPTFDQGRVSSKPKPRLVDLLPGLWVLGTVIGSTVVLGLSAWWTVNGLVKNTTIFSPNAVLDTNFVSHRGLDIVVSRYGESIDELVYITTRIQRLQKIAPLAPRIVIYNKDNDTASDALYNELHSRLANGTELLVRSAPNIGRESETYLRYMIDHWDDLATHTLFMQGHVHNEMEFLRRIQDYFVPTTGFLSLGFTGQACSSCDQCSDRHGWLEQPSVLRELSRFAHGSTGCRDIVLTYKGQYIASAARIRGIELDKWKLLQERFNNPDSAIHTRPYLHSRTTWGLQDSLDAPVFGFTMERMWGVMMQCSDMRIAERCPSLYAGLFQWRVDAGLCQCMDS